MALDVRGGENAAPRFLFDPHPLLHERTPLDAVLESDFCRPAVEGILNRLKYGTAV